VSREAAILIILCFNAVNVQFALASGEADS